MEEIYLRQGNSPSPQCSTSMFIDRRSPNGCRSNCLIRLHVKSALILKSANIFGSSGWGNGFNRATIPLWVSELNPAKSRGPHVAIKGNHIAFGIVIAYCYNIDLSYATGPALWRAPLASQGAIISAQIGWTMLLLGSLRSLICHFSNPTTRDANPYTDQNTRKLSTSLPNSSAKASNAPTQKQSNKNVPSTQH